MLAQLGIVNRDCDPSITTCDTTTGGLVDPPADPTTPPDTTTPADPTPPPADTTPALLP
jgi:hypothetical protein